MNKIVRLLLCLFYFSSQKMKEGLKSSYVGPFFMAHVNGWKSNSIIIMLEIKTKAEKEEYHAVAD